MDDPARPGPVDPRILDEALRREPSRPLPWRWLLPLLVPAAALAAGVGLQALIEGPRPPGDALLRWLAWSSAAGLLLGLVAGAVASRRPLRRAAWAALGAAGPWLAGGFAMLGVQAAVPLRFRLAERRIDECRRSRAICRSSAFRAACAAAGARAPAARARAAAAFGAAPAQQACDAGGCTYRWSYAGPWTPDDEGGGEVLWCSVLVGPAGEGLRSAITAAPAPVP